jgi:hypothetical protein
MALILTRYINLHDLTDPWLQGSSMAEEELGGWCTFYSRLFLLLVVRFI